MEFDARAAADGVRDQRLRVMRVIARMNVGGPALQVTALMRSLDPDRFEQRLYAGAVGADEADYLRLRAPDLSVHHVPGLGRSVRPGDDVRALAHLVSEMRRFRPHIVHTHTAKAGTLGRVAASIARVPARVHTFHGHLLHGYFSPAVTRMVVRTERALARRTDRLVAVGSQVRDDLLAAGIGRPDQYVVVPPGTVLPPAPPREQARAELGLPADGPVIAYVGRITGIKRPDRFVEVVRTVRASIPEATFAVCGEGDLLGDLVEATADLGDTVRILGWRGDVETVYAASDVTLLTSDNEGMPVSLIESGLAGVPAVATNVGSVAEVVVDGETGLLAGCDGEQLATQVIRLLTDDDLRLLMSKQAREVTVDRFAAQRLVADTDGLYTRIAHERGW
ncbi:glycosyltransferase family 4 protein [Planosporangium thailandense]|uniref:Glycosyltransferase family 4 protein n=1 Tax=Planosporangium thailandense TaxID=765197 RepID=A0ABX0XY15_9ACTN|nr:glycosyltransferase [Planosporangium thailandense]NJC70270.1 glycosyltransferase family 4 protein [Planosporangium thailandense]